MYNLANNFIMFQTFKNIELTSSLLSTNLRYQKKFYLFIKIALEEEKVVLWFYGNGMKNSNKKQLANYIGNKANDDKGMNKWYFIIEQNSNLIKIY